MSLPEGEKNSGISKPPDSALRQLLTQAIKQSGKKRPEIASEMSLLVGVKVTQHMLYDFTAQKKPSARFPACFVKAFCSVVGSSSIQTLLYDEQTVALMALGERVRKAQPLVIQIVALMDQIAGSSARGKKRQKR
jgi:hypothetical protein